MCINFCTNHHYVTHKIRFFRSIPIYVGMAKVVPYHIIIQTTENRIMNIWTDVNIFNFSSNLCSSQINTNREKIATIATWFFIQFRNRFTCQHQNRRNYLWTNINKYHYLCKFNLNIDTVTYYWWLISSICACYAMCCML